MYRMDTNIVPNVEIHTVSISLSANINEELNLLLGVKNVEILIAAQARILIQKQAPVVKYGGTGKRIIRANVEKPEAYTPVDTPRLCTRVVITPGGLVMGVQKL